MLQYFSVHGHAMYTLKISNRLGLLCQAVRERAVGSSRLNVSLAHLEIPCEMPQCHSPPVQLEAITKVILALTLGTVYSSIPWVMASMAVAGVKESGRRCWR